MELNIQEGAGDRAKRAEVIVSVHGQVFGVGWLAVESELDDAAAGVELVEMAVRVKSVRLAGWQVRSMLGAEQGICVVFENVDLRSNAVGSTVH